MRILLYVALLTLLPAIGCAAGERWVVYYSDKLPAEDFAGFDVIVFDREHHPPLEPLKDKITLGYISLGEAETYRDDFELLKQKNIFLTDNPLWEGHIIIDIRKRAWKDYMLNVLIPATLDEGFDGIMLDTTDSPVYLENNDPKKYAGMREAAIDLIRSMRQRYPDIKIMLNRGFDILPQVAGDIDMVMAETIYTDWQPGTHYPVIQPEATYNEYLQTLKAARRMSPKLKVYTIDYWPAEDRKSVQAISSRQREEGFVPYVAPSLDLDQVGSSL